MTPPGLTRRRLLLAAGAAAALPRPTVAAEQAAPSAWAQQKKYQVVDGVRMAYYEAGRGEPIVFLHGNPTSSYLWRKVIPHVQHLGRCIAPDLVGMGDSQKLDDSGPGVYTYVAHRRYLDGLLAALGVKQRAVFVIHDWGSALGFDWASRHPDAVRGLAYMEAILRPPGPDNPAVAPTGIFARLRSPDGERMVLDDNLFVDKMFLAEVGLYLSDEDRAEYRRPFLEPGESRRPTLTWPRELCFGGEPEENCEIIRRYSAWLAGSDIPKLFVRAEPGAIFRVKPLLQFARSLKNQKEVTVFGGHFVQEISGDAIGRALADWLPTLP